MVRFEAIGLLLSVRGSPSSLQLRGEMIFQRGWWRSEVWKIAIVVPRAKLVEQ
jgi:hypothetical protein